MNLLYRWTHPRAGEGRRLRTARLVWTALALTGLGCGVGVLALAFSATSCMRLDGAQIFRSYFQHPVILLLNLLFPVLLVWLFYFLSRRAWVGFLGSFLPTTGIALVNYYKIRLRDDPFLAMDLRLAAEAGGMVGGYTLELTWLVWFALFCLAAGLAFCLLLLPKGPAGRRERTLGTMSCLALVLVALAGPYTSQSLYGNTVNSSYINAWFSGEVFVSKGCTYSFLYSIRDILPSTPKGYNREQAAAWLAEFPDSSIPADRQVSVMGIMLEAFCDMTDFDALSGQEKLEELYAPWHALEEQSVSGDLLTNIFAGGTVDTEWGFLTGDTAHDEFRAPTGSYVWYFRDQGYQTFGSHPGYSWFYNRQNINQYLGFEEYWFSENHYAALVDPKLAIWNSDQILFTQLLEQLEERTRDGPCFSFSVSYQNHGPYSAKASSLGEYVTPAGTGLSQESCNILNNYLHGIGLTIQAVTGLVQGLEALDEPVVLVLFGDHKPWAGNGGSVYLDLGVSFDLSTLKDFSDYYSTPYLIWANSAAQRTLGRQFQGEGGSFSPCFLMAKLFDLCGWEGPGFLELSRQLRELTPLVHTEGLFLLDGALTQQEPEGEFYRRYLCMQYFREREGGGTAGP